MTVPDFDRHEDSWPAHDPAADQGLVHGDGTRAHDRVQALADLRRKLHRSAVAMSFLPAAELARHLGLPETGMAERLLNDPRLVHRLYWRLVDDDLVPDIGAIPDHGVLQVIDSAKAFEESCESVDIMLDLRETGKIIEKAEVKALARRYGDHRVRWAWDNRDIWSGKDWSGKEPAAMTPPGKQDAGAASVKDAPARNIRRRDARRLVLDHIAREIPDVNRWMGRDPAQGHGRAGLAEDAVLVAKVVTRLLDQRGTVP
jgi:hypothetical protein